MTSGQNFRKKAFKEGDMFVVYECCDEVIVTTRKKEHETIDKYFINSDRELADYERWESKDACITIAPRLRAE